ncbi:MAG: hypothetical protein CM1200mP16_02790 [Nitrospina sp.]|nr:MAG: hypothetical protein CM1200mP16_02790 [Nitrospina sp.]
MLHREMENTISALPRMGFTPCMMATSINQIFISFMFQVNWAKLDLIPVVGNLSVYSAWNGGAVFEFIWGIYNDQSREEEFHP